MSVRIVYRFAGIAFHEWPQLRVAFPHEVLANWQFSEDDLSPGRVSVAHTNSISFGPKPALIQSGRVE